MSTSPLGISLDTSALNPSQTSDSDDGDTPIALTRALPTHAPESSEQSTAPTEQQSEPANDTRRRRGRVSDQSTMTDSTTYSYDSADTASRVVISGPYDAATDEPILRRSSLPVLKPRYPSDHPSLQIRAVSLQAYKCTDAQPEGAGE
ncbi:hypothetical protein EVG20_g8422 [Dentipellis fragilis]|uniref:Uncharacterized protein n=1 Tax=Dentipellis fragilis TaxID=205917 RepID=A0A4Y9Y6Q8_9AGAM|nr:hypothetical protein EVG20_g8422 [Dentipellis fragilis]